MCTEANVVSLVAVRMKSKRLPGKALLDLCGKPVLWHLIDRIGRAKIPRKTVICTSTLPNDDPIAEFAKEYGLELFRGHPDNVLLRFIKAAEAHHAEHVVRATGDNPLTDPVLIDEMSKLHLNENGDYTYTEDPPRGTRPEVISLSALKTCLKLADDPSFSEYMTTYFKDHPQVFRNVRYSCHSSECCRPEYIVTVDTPTDLEIVKKIYGELYKKDREFSLLDLIKFLDGHPEIDHIKRQKPKIDASLINTRLKIA